MKDKFANEFKEFWTSTAGKVRAFMFCACENPADADDMTQDCCLRALRAWGQFDGRASRQAWLFGIARRARVDWLRKKKRENAAVGSQELEKISEAVPEESNVNEIEKIWDAVKDLNAEYSEVIHLRFAAGLSYEQIAQALFNEYLAENPQANKWASEMLAAYEKTEAAIDAKVKNVFLNQPVKTKPPARLNLLPFIRYAAIIIIAVCIGATAGWWSKPAPPQQKPKVVVVTSAPVAKKSGFNLDNLKEGFWRDRITAMLNPKPARIHRNINTGPSLFEQYQKYIKERNHE